MCPSIPSVTEYVRALGGADVAEECRCCPSFQGDTLVIDAAACPHDGALRTQPGCRRTAIDALAARDADGVRVESDGIERAYTDRGTALLVAAGRFVDAVEFRTS